MSVKHLLAAALWASMAASPAAAQDAPDEAGPAEKAAPSVDEPRDAGAEHPDVENPSADKPDGARPEGAEGEGAAGDVSHPDPDVRKTPTGVNAKLGGLHMPPPPDTIAVEFAYNEVAASPVSGHATQHWRFPSLRLTYLTPMKLVGFDLLVGGDGTLGGFVSSEGSIGAGSVFFGPHAKARGLVALPLKTPFVTAAPYAFGGVSSTFGLGGLIVGGEMHPRSLLLLGGEAGLGLWFDISGFLLRVDTGAGLYDGRMALSMSLGAGWAF